MPLYEYTCHECGHSHEEVRAMAQGPHTECQNCGAAVKQTYGVPTLNINGKYSLMHPRKMRGNHGKKPKATSS